MRIKVRPINIEKRHHISKIAYNGRNYLEFVADHPGINSFISNDSYLLIISYLVQGDCALTPVGHYLAYPFRKGELLKDQQKLY